MKTGMVVFIVLAVCATVIVCVVVLRPDIIGGRQSPVVVASSQPAPSPFLGTYALTNYPTGIITLIEGGKGSASGDLFAPPSTFTWTKVDDTHIAISNWGLRGYDEPVKGIGTISVDGASLYLEWGNGSHQSFPKTSN
jgi:hypothetical protein